jgi:hypothetical protein
MDQLYTYSQIFSSYESLLEAYDNGWWLRTFDTRFIGEWQSVRRPSTEVNLCHFAYARANIQPDNRIGDPNIGEKVAALLGCDLFKFWTSI